MNKMASFRNLFAINDIIVLLPLSTVHFWFRLIIINKLLIFCTYAITKSINFIIRRNYILSELTILEMNIPLSSDFTCRKFCLYESLIYRTSLFSDLIIEKKIQIIFLFYYTSESAP